MRMYIYTNVHVDAVQLHGAFCNMTPQGGGGGKVSTGFPPVCLDVDKAGRGTRREVGMHVYPVKTLRPPCEY